MNNTRRKMAYGAMILGCSGIASLVTVVTERATIAQGRSSKNAPRSTRRRPRVTAEADVGVLERELIETLRDVRSVLERERQSGLASSNDLIQANIDVLRAELETRVKPADRLDVLERIADQYRRVEENVLQLSQKTPIDPRVALREGRSAAGRDRRRPLPVANGRHSQTIRRSTSSSCRVVSDSRLLRFLWPLTRARRGARRSRGSRCCGTGRGCRETAVEGGLAADGPGSCGGTFVERAAQELEVVLHEDAVLQHGDVAPA